MVDSLIYQQSFSLDLKKIRLSILSADHLAILETCIGVSWGCDRLVWLWVNGGMFSMRSEYHWKCSHGVPSTTRPSSIPQKVREFSWNEVWKMHIPPKVKSFLWRALKGALATKLALFKHISSLSLICPIRNREDASVEHMLLFCPRVGPIWFGGFLNYRVPRSRITSLNGWLQAMASMQAKNKE